MSASPLSPMSPTSSPVHSSSSSWNISSFNRIDSGTTATVALTAVAAGLVGLCSSLARTRRRLKHTPKQTLTTPTETKSPHISGNGNGFIVDVPKSLSSVPSSVDEWISAFPSVRFNPSFWTKLEIIRRDGPSKFVSIVDFDWTLSGFKNSGGQICKTSYGVLTSSPLTNETFRSGAAEIKDKYFPFERDHSLSLEARSALMVKWWNEIHAHMIGAGLFTRQMVQDSISNAVKDNALFLRSGSAQFLQALHRSQIPLLVMSAGLHQTVENTLRTMQLFYPNTEVCANVMQFTNDQLTSFAPNMPIHSCNKSFDSVAKESVFRRQCDERKSPNVLVVGDSIGDVNMSQGLTAGQRLNIGFVNADADKRTPEFMNIYDAVILNDGSWDLVLTILRALGVASPST